MKITIYTITDCEFSKQEKEYFKSHQLAFEEKNLETNKDFLTEMLAVSNNFAGTPVTKIEKDDGKIEVMKGFTSADFDEVLGFVPAKKEEPPAGGEKKPEEATKKPEENQSKVDRPMGEKPKEVKAEPVVPPAAVETPAAAPQPTQSQPQTAPAVQSQPTQQPIQQPSSPPPASDPLNSILADLQAKSVAQTAETQPPTSNQATAPSMPSVPDFPAKT